MQGMAVQENTSVYYRFALCTLQSQYLDIYKYRPPSRAQIRYVKKNYYNCVAIFDSAADCYVLFWPQRVFTGNRMALLNGFLYLFL